MINTGGQRSERKKWIHCFEHVSCVIYVAALSQYNEVLFEDESQNALQESIELFDEICNLRWFETTPMVVFLNKKDLFEEKMLKYSLKECCFEDFDKENTYMNGVEFIKMKFEQQNKNVYGKPIYVHITNAIDKDNVDNAFSHVGELVIDFQLAGDVLL